MASIWSNITSAAKGAASRLSVSGDRAARGVARDVGQQVAASFGRGNTPPVDPEEQQQSRASKAADQALVAAATASGGFAGRIAAQALTSKTGKKVVKFAMVIAILLVALPIVVFIQILSRIPGFSVSTDFKQFTEERGCSVKTSENIIDCYIEAGCFKAVQEPLVKKLADSGVSEEEIAKKLGDVKCDFKTLSELPANQ